MRNLSYLIVALSLLAITALTSCKKEIDKPGKCPTENASKDVGK